MNQWSKKRKGGGDCKLPACDIPFNPASRHFLLSFWITVLCISPYFSYFSYILHLLPFPRIAPFPQVSTLFPMTPSHFPQFLTFFSSDSRCLLPVFRPFSLGIHLLNGFLRDLPALGCAYGSTGWEVTKHNIELPKMRFLLSDRKIQGLRSVLWLLLLESWT